MSIPIEYISIVTLKLNSTEFLKCFIHVLNFQRVVFPSVTRSIEPNVLLI